MYSQISQLRQMLLHKAKRRGWQHWFWITTTENAICIDYNVDTNQHMFDSWIGFYSLAFGKGISSLAYCTIFLIWHLNPCSSFRFSCQQALLTEMMSQVANNRLSQKIIHKECFIAASRHWQSTDQLASLYCWYILQTKNLRNWS